MYSMETTKDGKIFKPLFIEGRIREYANLNNARNGARQILKNPKNECVLVKIINKSNPKDLLFVKKTNTGYEEFTENNPLVVAPSTEKKLDIAVKKVETVKLESLATPNVKKVDAITLPVKKVDVVTKPVVEDKKVSLESLAEKPKESIKKQIEKDERIQSLKEAHDKWKQKKLNPPEIKIGDSVNNISDNHTVEEVVDVYSSLMESLLKECIDKKNVERLFKVELMMSQSGYSWYPMDNKIHVDTTENVVKKLKELKLNIDD